MKQDFTEQEIAQFERYYKGKMKDSEEQFFEQQLQNNKELAAKAHLYGDMMAGVQLAEEEKLQAVIQSVHQKLKQEHFFEEMPIQNAKPKTKIIPLKWKYGLAIAAGLALLIVTVFYWFPSPQISMEMAFEQQYAPEKVIVESILDTLVAFSAGDPKQVEKQALAQGLQLYETANYAAAIPALQDFLNQYPQNPIAHFYLGLSFLHEKDFKKAIAFLKPLEQEAGFSHDATLKWYLALAYTMTNEKQKASALFQQLKTHEKYGQEARFYLGIL